MDLIDPRGDVGGFSADAAKSARWPQDPRQAKIGFLSSGKPNIAAFFERLSKLMQPHGIETACSLVKPGPTVPAGTERLERIAKSADIIINGVCDGGTATSWGVQDALELVQRGRPVVLVCTEAFTVLARSMLPGEIAGLRMLTIPHPFSSLTDSEVEILANVTAPRLHAILQQAPDSRATAGRTRQEIKSPSGDEWAVSDDFYELGWTDGLPAFAPTRARVGKILEDRRLAGFMKPGLLVPPRNGEATPAAVVANAVLAGMPSRLLPWLAAAIEAACDAEFNLLGIHTTTNPTMPAVIVGGPHRREYDFNDGLGALGPGSQSNATLCRALRLCQQNLGGASIRAGTDPATLGQPGKYIFCLAEDEDASPWPPLRMQVGKDAIGAGDDAVTLVAATGTTNMIIKSRDAEELLQMLAGSVSNIGSNDYMFGGHPLLILCPEHAAILAREKWTLEAIQQRIFDTTRIPFSAFLPKNQEMTIAPRAHEFERLDQDTLLPIVEKPSDFLICVAGGPSMHSTFLPSFGGSTPATARVRLPK